MASKWKNGNENYAAWCHVHFILASTPTYPTNTQTQPFQQPQPIRHLLLSPPRFLRTQMDKWEQKRCSTMPRSCYVVLLNFRLSNTMRLYSCKITAKSPNPHSSNIYFPVELYGHIFKFVTDRKDLFALCTVSQSFHHDPAAPIQKNLLYITNKSHGRFFTKVYQIGLPRSTDIARLKEVITCACTRFSMAPAFNSCSSPYTPTTTAV